MKTEIINLLEVEIEEKEALSYRGLNMDISTYDFVLDKITINDLKSYTSVNLVDYCVALLNENGLINGISKLDDAEFMRIRVFYDIDIYHSLLTFEEFYDSFKNSFEFKDTRLLEKIKEEMRDFYYFPHILASNNEENIIGDELIKRVNKKMNDIFNKREELKKELKRLRKENKKIVTNYKKVRDVLVNIEKERKYIYRDKLNINLDDRLIYLAVLSILGNNIEVFKEIYALNKQIPDCDNNTIESLIYKHNLVINKKDKNRLIEYGILEKMEKILITIDKTIFKNLKNSDVITEILLLSDEEIIINLSRFSDLGVDFFKKNKEIFVSEKTNKEGKYELFIKNISLLKSYYNEIGNVLNYGSFILLVEHSLLNKYIRLLSLYNIDINLLFSKKNSLKEDEIFNPLLFEQLDYYIESNAVTFVLEKPLLLKDILIAKRLMCNKNYNFSISINDKLNLIFKDKINFPVNDNYLINKFKDTLYISKYDFSDNLEIIDEIINLDIIKWLDDNYAVNDLQYLIDDIYISRNKVLRNISGLYKKGIDINIDIIKEALKNLSNIDLVDEDIIDNIFDSYNPKQYRKNIEE